MTAAITDRHGFLLRAGSTVIKLADWDGDLDSCPRFVVTDVQAVGSKPVSFLLADGAGGVVDASLVTLVDSEKAERATFCQVCFNHYTSGVTWFKTSYDHQQRSSVYSSCEACLASIDRASLPEVAWAV